MKRYKFAFGWMIFLLMMLNSVSAFNCDTPEYSVNRICHPDNDVLVYQGMPSTVCNQTSLLKTSRAGSGEGGVEGSNCYTAGVYNISRAYWSFDFNYSDGYYPTDVIMACILYPGQCTSLALNEITLYSFSPTTIFNENTTTWNNQPITCNDILGYCSGNDIFDGDVLTPNQYDGDVCNEYRSGANWDIAFFNLTARGLYSPRNWGSKLNLMMFYNNYSRYDSDYSWYTGTYPLTTISPPFYNPSSYCYLIENGAESNYTLLHAIAYAGGQKLVNHDITLCYPTCPDAFINASCLTKPTDSMGISTFIVPTPSNYGLWSYYNGINQTIITEVTGNEAVFEYFVWNTTKNTTYYTFYGYVNLNGDVVNDSPAAVVFCGDVLNTTDEYGAFSLRLPAGNYYCTAVYQGVYSGVYTLNITNSNVYHNFFLSGFPQESANISVQVNDSTTGLGVGSGAIMYIDFEDITVDDFTMLTNSNGFAQQTFYSNKLGGGLNYDVYAYKTLYYNSSDATWGYPVFNLIYGGETDTNFVLLYRRNATNPRNITGSVRDLSNNNISGLTVKLRCIHPISPSTVVSGVNGSFGFYNIPNGETCFLSTVETARYRPNGEKSFYFDQSYSGIIYYVIDRNQSTVGKHTFTFYITKSDDGLSAQNCKVTYTIANGTSGVVYADTMGEVFIPNIPDGSQLIAVFSLEGYKSQTYKTFESGSDTIEMERDINIPTTIIGGVTTTSTTVVTTPSTTLFNPSNFSFYTPSNETSGLLTNAYNYIIAILTAVCTAIASLITVIIAVIFVMIVLFFNKVLNALGWKWSWFGLGD